VCPARQQSNDARRPRTRDDRFAACDCAHLASEAAGTPAASRRRPEATMTWTIGDVLEQTVRSFGRNWVALVVGNLVATLISFLPMALCAAVVVPPLIRAAQSDHIDQLALTSAIAPLVLSFLATLVLSCLFAPALSRMALAAARGEQPRVGQVFDFRRAGTFLGAGLLTGLAVMAASLLLVVPGIIVALALSLVSFFVVDDPRLGATGALEASWAAMRGHKLRLFGLVMVAAVANWLMQTIFGVTVWLAPLQLALALAWTPFVTLGLAQVYLRARPQPPALTAQAAA
jgi:hypothetical protein